MKKRILLTGALSLLLVGMVSCSKEETPSQITTTNPIPSTDVNKPLEPYYDGLDITKNGKEFIDKLSIIINRDAKIGTYKQAYDNLTITDADPLNPGYVTCLYTGQPYKNGINGNDRLWNREHVWCKSHGFDDDKFEAYRDLHHLRACEININSTRNNLDFGEVSDIVGKDDYGNKWSKDAFEPRDEVKGDVARMLFYMTVKYSSGDLKLYLVNEVPTGSSKGEGKLGKLDTLIKWHEEDPVSIEEVKRNEEVYKIQNNRNPFIDHPEFAENVFNVDINIPNDSVDKTNVEKVQELIDALPSEITNDNKDLVIAANEAYDKLTLDEKKLINDEKLIEALIQLENLLKAPDVPAGNVGLSINFNDAKYPVTGKYASNGTITVGEYEFFMSSYYMKGILTLGNTKDKEFDVPLDKFGLTGTGAYLEQKFITKNALSISINIQSTLSSFETWHIFFTEEGTTTPVEIATGGSGPQKAEGVLDTPKNGYFTFAVKGERSRAKIDEFKIGVSE